MFWPDVIALKEFYATPLGRTVRRAVEKQIQCFWPSVAGDTVMGLGFATPYLDRMQDEAALVIAGMPAAQGVIHWPPGVRNRCLLTDEAELPFADNSIPRVIIVHALENSEQARPMMAELWRVLSPAGRIIVVVPNRRGIWARSPRSPFAHGQPFTAWQLKQLLSEHSFTPLGSKAALFFAPMLRRNARSPGLRETLGSRFFPAFGGVLLMEAEKQIYAPAMPRPWKRMKRAYAPLAQPAGA